MGGGCRIGPWILFICNSNYLVFLISMAVCILVENNSLAKKRENKNTHNPTHAGTNIINSLIYCLPESFPGICGVRTIL